MDYSLTLDFNGTEDINGTEDNNGTEEWKHFSVENVFSYSHVRNSLIAAYSIVFLCCFFGNLTVITVICLHRRMRTATNFFLANLAFADLCVGIFCVYQNLLLYLTSSWAMGDFLCRMYHFVHGLSYTASILILVAISVERYVVIVHTLWGRRVITLRRLKITLALVWILSAIYNSPRLFVYGTVNVPSMTDEEEEVTLCILKRSYYNSKNYELYMFVILFAIPVVIMIILYLIIASKLWNSGNSFRDKRKRELNGVHKEGEDTVINREKTNHDTKEAAVEIDSADIATQCQTTDKKNVSVKWVRQCLVKPWQSRRDNLEDKNKPTAVTSTSSTLPKRKLQKSASANTLTVTEFDWKKRLRSSVSLNSNRRNRGNWSSGARVLRIRRRIIRLLVAVVVTFVVCNLPYHARKFWQTWSPSYDGTSPSSFFLTITTTLIFYMNSGINPFLYAFLSSNFRQCIADIFLCRKQKWNFSPLSTGRMDSSERSNRCGFNQNSF